MISKHQEMFIIVIEQAFQINVQQYEDNSCCPVFGL